MSEPPTSKFIDPRLLEQLLASNNIPEPEVNAGLKEYAASLEDASNVLHEELRNAQDLVQRLTRQIARIDEKLQAVKSVLNPVRALPADVLRVICSHLVAAPSELVLFGDYYSHSFSPSVAGSDTVIQNSLNPRNSIWSLSRVCQNWRDTIIESPSLWSTISVHLRTPGSDLPDAERGLYGQLFLLQLYLQRAKSHPLALLCWTTAYNMSPYHPLLAVLSPYLKHVRILVTNLPPDVTQTFFQTGSIANVEQLVSQINTEDLVRRTFDFSLCRKLWSIHINLTGVPGSPGVTTIYHLPDTVTHYRGLLVTELSDLRSLGNLSHLQDLSLIATNWDETLVTRPHIHLPALTRMYMELDMDGANVVAPIFQIINAPQLETLTIFTENCIVLPSFASIPTLSAVKTLHLMSPDILDGEFVSQLHLHAYVVPLLPRLQSLKLVEYSAEADIGASVIAVAESRRRDGNASALRKVSLAHEPNIDERWRENWETLQRDGLVVEYGAVNDVEKVFF
ncbi:hypothetical protein BDZ89DRAFT_1111711 [Hymenopellis radicata]|nr:hypothetical protein BDZ89DRAFT_1111711 [Hymenopellis radicata]